jgi:hypothetical protein
MNLQACLEDMHGWAAAKLHCSPCLAQRPKKYRGKLRNPSPPAVILLGGPCSVTAAFPGLSCNAGDGIWLVKAVTE